MPHLPNNARHWRERAAEMRRLSGVVGGPTEREHMLASAQMYDRLADLAEKPEDRGSTSPLG